MKLYQTPGGTWAGNEKDWATAMKAEGGNPKTYDGRKIVDVPTSKPELLEFLTFHGVNVINPQAAQPAAEVAPAGVVLQPPTLPPGDTAIPAATTTMSNPALAGLALDAAFEGAPIRQQLRLAVGAIDRADALLVSPVYQTAAA